MNKQIKRKFWNNNLRHSNKVGTFILESSWDGDGGISGFSFVMKNKGTQNNILE